MISTEPAKNFIIENFLFGDLNDLSDETSFMKEGIIDSIGMMELIEFLEYEYEVKIENRELIPENLDSLSNIGKFISKKTKRS